MTDALIPIEEREVDFYGDPIIAVRMANDDIFVPIRPICEAMGISWPSQRNRIKRDEVLSEEQGVFVMNTPGGRQEYIALPLDFIPGWLFGISARRVKPEIKENIITYRRECFRVLAEAMREGRLSMAERSFEDTLEGLRDGPAVQAFQLAKANFQLARSQVLMQADIERLSETVSDHALRLDNVEERLTPAAQVNQDQASQLSQSVKAVAMELGKKTGRNEFGGVYGELYRRYSITSYKMMPTGQFQAAMEWLTEWHQALVDDIEF